MKQASQSSDTVFSQASTPCPLDDFDALAIEGADAVAFAQAQFASDVGALAVGHWQWTCLLTPQGRVVVLGLLLRPETERLLLLAPGRRAAELAGQLQRFVLRRRVVLAPTQPAVLGTQEGAPTMTPADGGELARDGEALRIDLGGIEGRALRLGGSPLPADPAARAAWRLADALDGIPWIEGDAVACWIPQALGLGRLSAFSTRKGCYPGQEIVARTHFLGRNKRALHRAALPAGLEPPQPGTRLLALDADDSAEAAGEVVFAARTDARGALLAVLREDAPDALRAQGSGQAIAFEPLPPTGVEAPKML